VERTNHQITYCIAIFQCLRGLLLTYPRLALHTALLDGTRISRARNWFSRKGNIDESDRKTWSLSARKWNVHKARDRFRRAREINSQGGWSNKTALGVHTARQDKTILNINSWLKASDDEHHRSRLPIGIMCSIVDFPVQKPSQVRILTHCRPRATDQPELRRQRKTRLTEKTLTLRSSKMKKNNRTRKEERIKVDSLKISSSDPACP